MTEEVAPTSESPQRVIELAESRKGVFFQAEVGLPSGFEPPSASLSPQSAPAHVQVAPVQVSPDANAGPVQTPRER